MHLFRSTSWKMNVTVYKTETLKCFPRANVKWNYITFIKVKCKVNLCFSKIPSEDDIDNCDNNVSGKTAWAHTCPFGYKTKCSFRMRSIIAYKNLKLFSLIFQLLGCWVIIVMQYVIRTCELVDELSELRWKEWIGWDFLSKRDNHAVLGVPKTTPRFGDLLGGLKAMSI